MAQRCMFVPVIMWSQSRTLIQDTFCFLSKIASLVPAVNLPHQRFPQNISHQEPQNIFKDIYFARFFHSRYIELEIFATKCETRLNSQIFSNRCCLGNLKCFQSNHKNGNWQKFDKYVFQYLTKKIIFAEHKKSLITSRATQLLLITNKWWSLPLGWAVSSLIRVSALPSIRSLLQLKPIHSTYCTLVDSAVDCAVDSAVDSAL